MSTIEKTLEKVLRGTADANTRFGDLLNLLLSLRFEERIRGDHHILTRENIVEILNLQPRRGMAKSYQVKQVRNVILKYRLAEEIRASHQESEQSRRDPEQPSGEEP